MNSLRESLHADAVAGLAPHEPVVMLNLMKFRQASLDGNGSGWDAYKRYSALVSPLLKARRATILLAADVRTVALGSIADGDWDYVALVWYPRPAAFLDMVTSNEYATANVHRENATQRHHILATHVAYSKLVNPIG